MAYYERMSSRRSSFAAKCRHYTSSVRVYMDFYDFAIAQSENMYPVGLTSTTIGLNAYSLMPKYYNLVALSDKLLWLELFSFYGLPDCCKKLRYLFMAVVPTTKGYVRLFGAQQVDIF